MIIVIDEGKQIARRVLFWFMVVAFIFGLVGTYLVSISDMSGDMLYIGVLVLIITVLGIVSTQGKHSYNDIYVPGNWPVESVVMSPQVVKEFLEEPDHKENIRLNGEIDRCKSVEFVSKNYQEVSSARKLRREYENDQIVCLKNLIILYREEFCVDVSESKEKSMEVSSGDADEEEVQEENNEGIESSPLDSSSESEDSVEKNYSLASKK